MALSRKNHKKGLHPKPVVQPSGRFPLNQLDSVNMGNKKTTNVNG